MQYFRILPTFIQSHLDTSQMIKNVLMKLSKHGAVTITQCLPSMESTREMVDVVFSSPMKTLWSPMGVSDSVKDMWKIEAVQSNARDDAYTYKSLCPHNDGLYMQGNVPGLQVFHSLHIDPIQGCGITRLTDSRDVLKRLSPKTRDELSNLILHYKHDQVDGSRVEAFHPVISQKNIVDETGTSVKGVDLLLYNQYDLINNDKLSLSQKSALKTLESLIDTCSWNLLLNEGTTLIINNQRIMHGRTALSSKSKRMLIGCYVQQDAWYSRLRKLSKN
jgi:alpha-ketoglutarate-dependent taurine dioxygenase